jgi:hypothetical protein
MSAVAPLTQTLRTAKQWLNGGECCGQVDSAGICAAPACIFGDACKWMYRAADEIERQQDSRRNAEAERDAVIAENRELRKALGKVRAHLVAMQLYGATRAMRAEAEGLIASLEKLR